MLASPLPHNSAREAERLSRFECCESSSRPEGAPFWNLRADICASTGKVTGHGVVGDFGIAVQATLLRALTKKRPPGPWEPGKTRTTSDAFLGLARSTCPKLARLCVCWSV